MALPRKKRRRLTIENNEYFWLVGKRKFEFYERANTTEAPVALLHFNVVIEAAAGKSRIIADFHGLFALCVPSLGFSDAQNIVITPAIVSNIISYAKRQHAWNDDKSGELRLNQAQTLFPEAIWEGFAAINTEYDAAKIEEYLSDAVQI